MVDVVMVILGVAVRTAASDSSTAAGLGAPLSAPASPTGSTLQFVSSSL